MNVCHENYPVDSSCGPLHAASTDNQIVLFVDDEPTILETRRAIFETLRYTVLTADSGEQALELLRERKVDCVVLDYQMPAMDGEETARRIRKGYGSGIRIISCSGSLLLPPSMMRMVDASLEKGAGPQALINVVKSTLLVPS